MNTGSGYVCSIVSTQCRLQDFSKDLFPADATFAQIFVIILFITPFIPNMDIGTYFVTDGQIITQIVQIFAF